MATPALPTLAFPLRFHNDPGHGWLQVPRSALAALNIAGQISRYSYLSRDGQTAYLEEDCDAPLFMRAMGWQSFGEAERLGFILDEHTDADSFVRSLPHYPAAGGA